MAVGETSGRSPRFSPDGNSVLLIDDAGLRLWDGAASASLLSQDNVEVATFDSDGRRVFVGLDDGSARILDAKTGAILTTLKASGQVTSVQFSTDGNSLLTTWDDHKARMWDATTGTLRFELDGVEAARFSPDSSHILTTGNNFDVRIWDSATGQMQLALKHDAQVNWGSYSPDGKHIVTGTYDYSVTVWDAISGEIEYVLRGTDDSPLVNISEPAFSSDGRFIAAAFNGGEVRIWDARNYAIRVPGQSLTSAVLSPNGQLVVTTTSGKNDADLWDANRGALILTLQGHQARINSVVFSRDGSSILTGSNDGTVRIWDARTGDCIKVLNPDIGPISSANYTDDGQSVAIRVGAGGRKFQVLNLQTEEVLSTADRVMAWSANAKRVVAYAGSGTLKVQVLDLDSKNSVILEDVWDIDYAKFSPDGARVATYGPRVRIWDARTGADMLTLPRMSVEQVDFSPDGKRVVLEPEWPWDKVAVWDIDTRQKITEFDAGEIQAHDAIFSPDGKFVLTGHDGGTARLWDAQTGHSMGVLKTSGYVTKVQFSQDGHAILTTGETTAELWDTFPLAAENARAYASLIEVRDFTKDERKQFSLPPQDEAKSRFQADDPSVTDCDRQAANPVDPRKRTFGVQFANIKDEAVAACQSALKQNPDDPRLLYQLGRALQKQGSLARALDMYQRSAAKEYAAAYNNLGNVYQSGNGVDRDIGKAIAYFEQAFQKGFPYAGFTIYGIYWNGQYVPQDRKTAVAWLNRAASQGEPQSNFRLAVLYEHGQEVTEDLNRALFHWAVAESLFRAAELDGTWPRGNGEYARLRRIALSRGMRSADVIETAKKVFDWSPNTAN
jgi:WD40 repeat protein